MSLSSPSPLCTVNAASTINGVNATAASTVTIALVDTAGVKTWAISCINTDDLLVASTVTAGLTIDTVAKEATFTAPAAGSALIFQSVVNGGKDANGVVDPTLTTTFGVYVLTTSGYRVAAFDEKTEGSASFGWVTKVNAVVRNNLVTPASAGDGIAFGAGAYSVNPDANGSIVVTAGGVKVGTLPSLAVTAGATVGTTLAVGGTTTVGGALIVTGAAAMGALAASSLDTPGNVKAGGGIGLHGAVAAAQPTITGSTGGNVALQNLLAHLATRGDIINSTT